MGARLLAYSHDGYGLGHLRRNSRLVRGLRARRPDLETLFATGAKAALRLPLPADSRVLQLPPVIKVANGAYAPDDRPDPIGGVIDRRAALIADAVSEFRPDLLLVDRYPRGMHDELVSALDVLRCVCPEARAVLGLRDIIDEPAVVRDEWVRLGHNAAITEVYERVLVYGDPAVFDPVTTYKLPREVADRARFTGYLGDDLSAPEADAVRSRYTRGGRRLAVCMLGGGRDARPVADVFLSAVGHLAHDGWDGLLVTGPYMNEDDVASLRAHPMAGALPILEMVSDAPAHLAAADVAVCMGGYNTMCEVVALAVPAVVIPRVQPRREQLMRCERFAARGLISYVHPQDLQPRGLAAAIATAALQTRTELGERFGSVEHRGVTRAAEVLDALLPERVPTP